MLPAAPLTAGKEPMTEVVLERSESCFSPLSIGVAQSGGPSGLHRSLFGVRRRLQCDHALGSFKVPICRDEFEEAYPTLFHVSLAQNIGQVMRHGLLSTSALLDLCDVHGEERFAIESCQRPRSVPISHSIHGCFLINDQAPMIAAALAKCLIDLSPEQWCRSLNRRLFFWPTQRRLARHIGARFAAALPRIVIALDTKSTFEVLDFDAFEFSAINSGNTMRKAAPRGSATFLKASDYPFQERRKSRGRSDAIAEVTYPYTVTSSQLTAICMTSEIVSLATKVPFAP